jgi:HK97 family phage major capsid protein
MRNHFQYGGSLSDSDPSGQDTFSTVLQYREALADQRRLISAKAEFGKLGIEIGDSTTVPKDRSGQLTMRNKLRAAINALNNSIGEGKTKITPAVTAAMDHAATMVNFISHQIDFEDSTALQFGDGASNLSGGAKAGGWRDSEGRRVVCLGKGDRLNRGGESSGIGFGQLLRAVAFGTRDVNVKNALGESSIGSGGATVPTHLSNSLIDNLRARTVSIQAGAQTVILETQTTRIARLTADPVAAWRNENAAVGGTLPTFDNVTFNARSLAVAVPISRELLEDSVNIDAALMNAFARSLAVTLDQACLNGSGVAPIPTGILNTSGIGTSAAGLGYAGILDAQRVMLDANANPPTAAIMSPATWQGVVGDTDTLGQPKRPAPAIEALPLLSTTSMPNTSIIVGDFTNLLIGLRSDINIELFREPLAGNLQYLFIAHLRADVQLAHAASFVELTA